MSTNEPKANALKESEQPKTKRFQFTLARMLGAMTCLCVAACFLALISASPSRAFAPFLIAVAMMAAAIGTLRGGKWGAFAWFILALLSSPVLFCAWGVVWGANDFATGWIVLLFIAVGFVAFIAFVLIQVARM